MLITLWAKAEERHYTPPFLIDKKAEEMIPLIDYDFSKFSKSKFSQAGVCLRASLIDKEVQTFISAHPDAPQGYTQQFVNAYLPGTGFSVFFCEVAISS